MVVGRTVLHHLAFPEVLLGRMRGELPSGARLSDLEAALGPGQEVRRAGPPLL